MIIFIFPNFFIKTFTWKSLTIKASWMKNLKAVYKLNIHLIKILFLFVFLFLFLTCWWPCCFESCPKGWWEANNSNTVSFPSPHIFFLVSQKDLFFTFFFFFLFIICMSLINCLLSPLFSSLFFHIYFFFCFVCLFNLIFQANNLTLHLLVLPPL